MLVACGLRAGLGLAALDLPGFRTVDVVGWNPLGVVGCCGCNSGAGAFIGRLSFGALSATGGFLLARLATLALLREVGCDPDSVEEVGDTNKAGQEEEVEEDAAHGQSIVQQERTWD